MAVLHKSVNYATIATLRGANGDYAAGRHCIIYIILLVRIDHVFKRHVITPRTTVSLMLDAVVGKKLAAV